MLDRLFIFIFGSIVGSFLNVCIHRMPFGESIVWPHSHCPKCKKKIPAYDNIPFLSYIILKGRCRFCKERISIRYPLVEFLTAFMFLILYNHYGLGYDLFFYSVFICGLIIATFVDIAHRIIPDEVSIGGTIIGFILYSVKGIKLRPLGFSFGAVADSFLGMIIGAGMIYLTGVIFDLIYFRLLKKPPIQGETESMGGGDVKFLAMIGAFLGWQRVLLTFFLAPFFGSIFGISNLITKKDHTIPYGPFLSLAAVLSLLFYDRLIGLLFLR